MKQMAVYSFLLFNFLHFAADKTEDGRVEEGKVPRICYPYTGGSC